MSLLLFAAWAAASALFAWWRSRVLEARRGTPDVSEDGPTSLFVRGGALIVLLLILML